ncbi:MAG: adenylate/guanylate cyclase domain-containing protein [Candidatus Gracilibacteria bacterium]|nr:adenylate/guanylate cyclase domain-containing protein [Candidatus Gracilibacteria bacterium]
MLNLQSLSKNKPLLSVLLSAVIFIFIFLFSFDSLNKAYHSSMLRLGSESLKSNFSDDIVIVGIDERSLQKLGRFPFDRSVYIDVINNLNNAGVSVIGIDLILADFTNDKTDNSLAQVIDEAGNIVLGGSILSGNKIEKPLDIFFSGALSFGFFTQDYERNYNVIHRFSPVRELMLNGTKQFVDHFSISILKAYYYALFKDKNILKEKKFDEEYYYITQNKKIPFSGKGYNSLISFAPVSRFTEISFIDAYDAEQLDLVLQSISGNGGKEFSLKDKIVLIGTTSKGLKDIFNTPNGVDYGVHVHANIINTVLTNSFYTYFNENLELILIFLLIITSFYLNLSKGGYIIVLSNIALVSIFLVVFPFFIYSLGFILNRPADLAFALVLSLLLSNIVKYLIENKNKAKVVKALSEYISKDIAQKILSSVGDVSLEGERKKVSIFFSDIAGFTTISEKFTPEDLVHFLREYLGAMSNIIMDDRGFIDKYEGDAIMALYGVFGFEESSSYDNCKVALLQQEKLRELNIRWKEVYGEELEVRMGIHSGDVIVGNIGAEGRKMEFTALGDNVNLASRLEGVNKFYGTHICASEDIKNEVGNNFVFRYLDKIRVKGKNSAVNIYELIGFKDKVEKYKLEMIAEFEKALYLYFDKKFEEAENIFEKLSQAGDKPSKVFIDRCKTFMKAKSSEDWDGVWEMKEK